MEDDYSLLRSMSLLKFRVNLRLILMKELFVNELGFGFSKENFRGEVGYVMKDRTERVACWTHANSFRRVLSPYLLL